MLTLEQKKLRLGKITSSVAAAALGLNKRMTPLAAWMCARGEMPDIRSKMTQRGELLEEVTVSYPLELMPEISRFESAPFRQHKKYDFFGDSSDALYFAENGKLIYVGEAKTSAQGMGTQWGEEKTDQIPIEYLIQCHWHLAHWPEVDTCLVPVLIGGFEFEFRLYQVTRNIELEGILLEDLAKWHKDYVQSGKIPPVTSGDTEYIQKLYPENKMSFMPDSPAIESLVLKKQELGSKIKTLQSEEECVKNQLRSIIGDHEGVSGYWGKLYYRGGHETQKIDWEKVAKAAGAKKELINQYSSIERTPRVLRIYLNKENRL